MWIRSRLTEFLSNCIACEKVKVKKQQQIVGYNKIKKGHYRSEG